MSIFRNFASNTRKRFFAIDSSILEVRLHTSEEEVSEVKADWYELAEASPSSTLTQYPDYTLAYLRSFESSASSLHVATVRLAGRLCAVLPFMHRVRKIKGFRVCTLEFPDYPIPIRDVIFDGSLAQKDVLIAFLKQVSMNRELPWDYLQYRGVLEQSALVPLAEDNQRAVTTHYDFSHALDVTAGNYVKDILNSKARNNLRRNARKLAELGRYEFKTVTTFPEMDGAFEAFLHTEAAGWKSVKGGRRAIKLHEDQTAFYLDLLRRNAKNNRAHIHLLYLDGKAIASDLCILTSDICYSLKHGYDESYAHVAPSNLLREYAVNYYCTHTDVNSIDLVSGQEWHLAWRPMRRKVFDVKFFNTGARATLLYRYYQAKSRSRTTAES